MLTRTRDIRAVAADPGKMSFRYGSGQTSRVISLTITNCLGVARQASGVDPLKSFGLSRRRGPRGLASAGWGSRIVELEGGRFTEESLGRAIRLIHGGGQTISRNHDCMTRCIMGTTQLARPDYLRDATLVSESFHPLRVMVVEDHNDTANSLRLLLNHWGIEVRVCRDGMKALEEALSYQPDVALIDIMMPGMDGYQLARRLREHEALKNVLLIATTGLGDPDNRRLARGSRLRPPFAEAMGVPATQRDSGDPGAEEPGRSLSIEPEHRARASWPRLW